MKPVIGVGSTVPNSEMYVKKILRTGVIVTQGKKDTQLTFRECEVLFKVRA